MDVLLAPPSFGIISLQRSEGSLEVAPEYLVAQNFIGLGNKYLFGRLKIGHKLSIGLFALAPKIKPVHER